MRFVLRKTLSLAAVALSAALYAGPTPQQLDVVVASNEMLLKVKFTQDHRARLRTILAKEWTPSLSDQIDQLGEGFARLRQLPVRTRELAIRAHIIGYLERLEVDVRGGDAVSILMREIYVATHQPLHPSAPLFSAHVADAYVDAYLFLGGVQSNKPSPNPSLALRDKLRKEVAGDYVKMTPKQREQMTQAMQKVTSFMIQWPELDELERLMVRAECGARLSLQEQQLLQQYQHMMRNHNLRMVTNELNFMRESQQTIMGSAPYWNPAANRWEQKGGIITEFQ